MKKKRLLLVAILGVVLITFQQGSFLNVNKINSNKATIKMCIIDPPFPGGVTK